MIQQTSDRIVQYQNEMKILILYCSVSPLYFAKPTFSEIDNGAHLYPLHFTANNSAKPAHDDARIVPHGRYTLQLLFK